MLVNNCELVNLWGDFRWGFFGQSSAGHLWDLKHFHLSFVFISRVKFMSAFVNIFKYIHPCAMPGHSQPVD